MAPQSQQQQLADVAAELQALIAESQRLTAEVQAAASARQAVEIEYRSLDSDQAVASLDDRELDRQRKVAEAKRREMIRAEQQARAALSEYESAYPLQDLERRLAENAAERVKLEQSEFVATYEFAITQLIEALEQVRQHQAALRALYRDAQMHWPGKQIVKPIGLPVGVVDHREGEKEILADHLLAEVGRSYPNALPDTLRSKVLERLEADFRRVNSSPVVSIGYSDQRRYREPAHWYATGVLWSNTRLPGEP